MRRAVLTVLGLTALACGPSAPPEPFFGDWTVSSVAGPGASAVAPAAGGQEVGTDASFSGRTAKYGARECSRPTYTRRWLSPATFTNAYHVPPASLGLTGAQVEFVDVTCAEGSLEQAGTLIVRPDGTLVTANDGVFYVLTRR
jgi:hypothetical protein